MKSPNNEDEMDFFPLIFRTLQIVKEFSHFEESMGEKKLTIFNVGSIVPFNLKVFNLFTHQIKLMYSHNAQYNIHSGIRIRIYFTPKHVF